jgi:hypothetical protein
VHAAHHMFWILETCQAGLPVRGRIMKQCRSELDLCQNVLNVISHSRRFTTIIRLEHSRILHIYF